jgi:hypothetical protein
MKTNAEPAPDRSIENHTCPIEDSAKENLPSQKQVVRLEATLDPPNSTMLDKYATPAYRVR